MTGSSESSFPEETVSHDPASKEEGIAKEK
jgi:hypothetical protein